MSLPAPASLRPVLAAVKAKALRGGLRPALTAAAVRRLISAGGNGPQERLTRPQDQQSGKPESLPNSGRCKPYLDYPRALAAGWPIATGVIEGACRHLVQDRMGVTGARWGLEGAQAILWLRAIRANGDLDTYWDWHITQEHHRNHLSRYQPGLELAA